MTLLRAVVIGLAVAGAVASAAVATWMVATDAGGRRARNILVVLAALATAGALVAVELLVLA